MLAGSLWIPITIAAALLQTLRTSLQKHLGDTLSPASITFVRFAFGLPVALGLAWIVTYGSGIPLPVLHPIFWSYAFGAAVFQALSTLLLMYLFRRRNFAISTTYARTEAVQAAIFGLLFFDEIISLHGFLAITMGVFGIMLISVGHTHLTLASLFKGITRRAARLGIACGTFFALSALCIRSASLSLDEPGIIIPAMVTLAAVMLIETLLLGFYILIDERRSIPMIVTYAKPSLLIGLTSVIGSVGWFTAMTLQKAAYVKTVGQIEIIFSLIIAHIVFKEHSNRYEIIGMGLVIASIIGLVFAG